MIVRPAQLRPIPPFLLPFSHSPSQTRCLHQRAMTAATLIPKTTPFVPNSKTFLKLIGRDLSKHSDKIKSWNSLFTLTSEQLKELGVEPPRTRRYLLRWREKFRKGQFGIGGDLKFVEKGSATLRVVEVEEPNNTMGSATLAPGKRKVVVNVPAGEETTSVTAENMVQVKGVHIKGAHTIIGPSVQPLQGGRAAKIEVKEGLWEDRRGHKIEGGERRQAEVRAKKRGEERRAAR
ncbi:IGR protein motif-domain-containing protein [Tricladium varicosporioides]|nr:IGR protein motif-domain-containing protein [Hymenoscyphus varicosporioides]